ncbi:unnamed protein product, partial [Pylaiella littoralis]
SDTCTFRLGQKVEGRFRGKGRWYKGRIVGVNSGGKYDVRYEDGDEDLGLDASAIKSEGAKDSRGAGGRGDRLNSSPISSPSGRDGGRRGETGAGNAPTPRIGDQVESRVPGTSRWQRATVVGENRNGTLDVRLRDGTEEKQLEPNMVRAPEDGDGERGGRGRDRRENGEKYRAGDKVEARFGGRSRWFRGTVERQNRDGTFHIIYADGDEEREVEKSLMRRIGGGSETPRSGSRSPGRRVISGGGSDVDLPAHAALRRGDKVEARYKRGRQWFVGTLRQVNRDGTYDIRYKDGDCERDVDPSLVRTKGGASIESLASSSDAGFSRGDKVEARFGGRSRWFKATVERENRDGTFHLFYEDGDEERAVGRDLIRRVGGATTPSPTGGIAASRSKSPTSRRAEGGAAGDRDVAVIEEFVEGDRVEARFGGRARWLRATVERKNRDGTYWLLYADGDEERTVDKTFVRALGGGSGGSSPQRTSMPSAARRGVSKVDSTSDLEIPKKSALRANDEIEAKYKGGHKWYPGVVLAVNRSGTYDVRYKDGDREFDMDARNVRSSSTASLGSSVDVKGRRDGEYVEGDKVEARFGGRPRWFTGKVARANRDGTYHIVYVDGDEERSVPKSFIRRPLGSGDEAREESKGGNRADEATDGRTKVHRVGGEIEARYKKGRKWYPGKIQAVNRDGTYDIRYADGDSERDVEPELVRDTSTVSLDSAATGDELLKGDRVEARFGGRSRWSKATVDRKHRDGTYSLRYDDGEEEVAVEKRLIRGIGARTSPRAGSRSPGRRVVSGVESETDNAVSKVFRVGDDIEARYQRGLKWFPGVIRAINRDGTYDIRYKDGDSERDVEPGLIRGLGMASTNSLVTTSSESNNTRIGSPSGSDFVVGEKVEARFGGRSRWFKATVDAKNRDGTYDLLYADGDEERRVAKELIRTVDGGTGKRQGSRSPGRRVMSGAGTDSEADPVGRTMLRKGDEIEARFKRGSKYYPGVISAVNRDGTYDIRYKDGDSERSVDRALIKENIVGSVDSFTSGRDINSTASFSAGDEVEARLGGRSRCNYNVGDRVEARFGGRSRWFKATVERENSDGTYYLLYADGGKERAVDKSLIRRLAGASGEAKRDVHSAAEETVVHGVGDEIEARYKRGRKWYPGKIRAVNLDGTYDVRYKDGDSERGVQAAFVRRVSGTVAEPIRDISVGDKVEGRFGGGSRWYEAIVKRKNRDDTFWLLYTDGDVEKAVERAFIRAIDVTGGGRNKPESSRRVLSRTGSEIATDVDLGEVKDGDRGGSRDLAKRRDPPRARDEIEARFRGGSRWLRGRVIRVHRDGAYSVEYEDGRREDDLPASHVRTMEKTAATRSSDDSDLDRRLNDRDGSRSQAVAIVEGDHVEARLRGRSTWHKGEATKVHSDGTYDVRYSRDGESEKRIDPRLVRLPLGATTRASSRGRGGVDSSSGTEGHGRGVGRGRRKERGPTSGELTSVDAQAAAAKMRRALRHAGKTIDDFARKLNRVQRASGGRDSRGRSIIGGVDKDALGRVLTGIGVELLPHEARALRRLCPDGDNDGCINPFTLTSLVKGTGGSPTRQARSSGSRTCGGDGRRSSSFAAASDQSASDSGAEGGSAAVARRRRVRSQSRNRRRSGSTSSLDNGRGSGGSDSHRRSRSREQRIAASRLSSSPTRKRKSTRGEGGTSSESEGGGGGSSSAGRAGGDALVSKAGLRALKKLESPAFDGSLRQEYDKLSDGRRHELSMSNFKSLLRRLRVKVEDSPLTELVTVLDPDDIKSISLSGLLEVALSNVEDKQISKIHGDICEQIFKPSGRLRKSKESQVAKASSATVSKIMSKLEHPKGSGLLQTGDLKKMLQKAGAKVSNENVGSLAERLDPADRGKIDRRALAVWLTSGFDAAQAKSRASGQLCLLKAKKIRHPEKAFKEFDVDGQGEENIISRSVRKTDFVRALGKLGLVLTHGQAATLAAIHHGDYENFLATLGDRRQRQQEEGAGSEGSGSEGAVEGSKRRNSWIKSFGRRQSTSTTRRSRRGASGGREGSSENSDAPLTSGSSNGEEDKDDGEDEEDGLLLGKGAREALQDAFLRACSTTGGVKKAFRKAAGQRGGSQEGSLSGREQTRRFLRRLKFDLTGDDLDAVIDALAGPSPGGGGGGDISDRSSHERGVSFESDGRGTKKAKRDGGDGGGGSVGVLYRDFLELVLAEQESKMISKIHGRMSKDLAKAADRSARSNNTACPFALVVKALTKHDTEGLGFAKASDFKRSLEKLGFGGLGSAEKSLLVKRFDPAEEGMINCEVFGAWLSSGLDPDRLTAKLGRLLGQLTGKCGTGAERKKRRRLKGGVRSLFEKVDQDATGTASRHDMKMILRRKLGLPLTEGDLRALFKRLDKGGDGMLDYEELLALASKRGRSDGIQKDKVRNVHALMICTYVKAYQPSDAATEGKGSKRGGTSDDSSSSDRSSESDASKDDKEGGGKKRHSKEKKKKKKRKDRESEKLNNKKPGRNRSAIKGRRLESKLLTLRVSILQQSTAAAAADEKEDGDSGDDGESDERRGSSPAAVALRWTAMLEARDRAGTGRATAEDLRAVFEKGGVKISEEDRALLVSQFAAPSADDQDDADSVEERKGKEIEEKRGAGGGVASPPSPSVSAMMDYDAFVRWLSEGGGLDDALLRKVQRHLKGRLSKAMDLRALFTEMCAGGGGKHAGSGRDDSHAHNNSTKDNLSSSRLARGLKHAGLPLDRALVNLLVAAFSTSGAGGLGSKVRYHSSSLSYADFHRMVHCDGLLAGGSAALEAGGGGGSRTLDEQIRSTLLETVERAFAFYDEDNANSIDATEVVNILRALGHDITRGESRALLRKANVDRNGGVQFEGFQEAVMPFLLERAQSKKLTEGEMRAMFDEIDTDRSGTIKREEFAYLFCGKLRLLSHEEAEALLGILDRHHNGHVSWTEFVQLFEIVGDQTGGGGIAALPPDIKEVVSVALRKVQMGTMPDVEGQLSSFLGMPSCCRRSVLAPLDHIKELSLQWVLMPKLDSRGCIQVTECLLKVRGDTGEGKISKSNNCCQPQTFEFSSLHARKKAKHTHSWKAPKSNILISGMSQQIRNITDEPHKIKFKTSSTQASAVLGAGLMETTTTVMKRATLQEVGASTEEGGKRGHGGGRGDSSGVMQVELSVKHAFGIPVARDSRMGDIRQRGMRACLFYDTGSEVDKDTGETSSEYGEHFLCNTYKTLAIQHPQKEEQARWLFPDSAEGERKFLVRTDFGSGGGGSKSRQARRRGSSRNRNHNQGTGDDSPPPSSSFRGDRNRLFLLVELTCTVQTAKDGAAAGMDSGRGGGRGEGAVRGPLKNFRVSGGSSGRGDRKGTRRGGRVGGVRGKGGGDDGDGSDSSSSANGESDGGSGSGSSSNSSGNNNGNKKRRGSRGLFSRNGKRKSGKTSIRKKNPRSAPPPRGGRHTGPGPRDRRGVRSEDPGGKRRRRGRNNGSESDDYNGSHSGESEYSSASNSKRGRRGNKGGGGKGVRAERRRGRDGDGGKPSWGRKNSGRTEAMGGAGVEGGGVVEVEMSCGWVLIPFLELVEAHEVKKVRYKLLGGTPFAKMDIDEDEVMTRRYGWRAVLKAMKIEGMHKGSEVEIKILPVNALAKLKQEDIFRLPRNVILSDTFVSLVRHYREYAANSLAKRSARGMGNVGFGAGSASSEPVLALFPRLAADPALMMALKNQWEAEVRKTHIDGRLGATISSKLVGLGLGGGGGGDGSGGGGLVGVTGAAREACLLAAFEKAVMRMWPAFCHIDAQRGRVSSGEDGAESYEELESRGQRIRQILDSTDSFNSDTPTKAVHGEDG